MKTPTGFLWLCQVVLVLGLLSASGMGVADEQRHIQDIRWLKSDVPPIGISSGPFAGQGLHGGIIRVLSDWEIDEIDVEYHANMARLFVQIQSDNYCVPGLIKTEERSKAVVFTEQPSAIVDSSHLIYAADNQKLRASLHDEVSLKDLLEDGFVVGTGAGVSYGNGIDEIIQAYEQAGRAISHPAPNFIEPILAMVEKGRVDFFVAPPWVLTWRFVNQGLEQRSDFSSRIATHPFREAAEKMSYYLACTKNAWGRKTISMLDSMLARPEIQEQLAQNSDIWMSVAAAKAHFVE